MIGRWIRLAAASGAAVLLGSAPSAQEGRPAADHPRDILTPSLPPFAPALPQRVALDETRAAFVLRDDTSPLLRGTIRFPLGSVDEPAQSVGVASILAEVMEHSGSDEHPGLELDAWLAAQGARLSIAVDLETFEIRFSCPPEAASALFERVGSLLHTPAIDAAAVEHAARLLATDLAARHARPDFLADRALAVVAYGADSPYARRASAGSLQGITPDDVRAFAEKLRGSRPVVGLLGRPGDEQLAALGAALAGDATAEAEDDESPSAFAGFIQPARTRVWVVDRPQLSHAEVRLAAPGVRRLDPDASKLELWSRIVGHGGETQRMGERFPDRKVAAGFFPEWDRAGSFLATFSAPVPEVGATLTGMLAVLERARTSISDDDVERVRGRLMNEELIDTDSPAEALARYLELELHAYPEDYYRQRVLSWRNADAEALTETAQARLDLGRMVIVAVGPLDLLAEQLAPFGGVQELGLERALAPGANQPAPVEAMFDALGGRKAWAEAAAIHAQIDIVLPDREIPSRQWSDLGGPRFRAEYLVASETMVLIVDAERALQVGPGGRTQLDEAAHAQQLEAKRKTLWQVLHQLARGADLRVRMDEERNLTVQDDRGLDLSIELDENDLPTRIVDRTAPETSARELSDWAQEGAVLIPRRIAQPAQGLEWRVHSFEVLEAFDGELMEAGE